MADTDATFDSSRERKVQFTFTLNSGKINHLKQTNRKSREYKLVCVGKVVKAWELAIPTMKVGEKAEITCTSDYGNLDPTY